jgi:uncharacterized membrane-anchored protein
VIVGHFALGLAAKRVAPHTSLGTLQLASAVPDLLAFAFLILGVEHARIAPGITAYFYIDAFDIAISHSLVMDVVWAALFGFVYRMRQGSWRGAGMVMGLVLSHWVLDAVSHRPEIPIAPGLPQRVGLGLWNSLLATFLVEGTMWVVAVALYVRATSPRRPAGTCLLCVVVAVLTLLWIAIPFLPPPTNLLIAEVRNLVSFSVILAAFFWLDRLRAVRSNLQSVKLASG